jgi:hypothetical protein
MHLQLAVVSSLNSMIPGLVESEDILLKNGTVHSLGTRHRLTSKRIVHNQSSPTNSTQNQNYAHLYD